LPIPNRSTEHLPIADHSRNERPFSRIVIHKEFIYLPAEAVFDESARIRKKTMSSLFVRKRNLSPEMLTLPAFCIPADESAKLLSKREAQLEWMRAQGVQYILGRQVQRHTPTPRVTAAPAPRVHVADSPRLTPYPQSRVA
jgi:hypothetical protein